MKGSRLFKVGDRVWSIDYGWGKVETVKNHWHYPVEVIYDNGIKNCYTLDGREYINKNRTLFFDEIPIPQSALDNSRTTEE